MSVAEIPTSVLQVLAAIAKDGVEFEVGKVDWSGEFQIYPNTSLTWKVITNEIPGKNGKVQMKLEIDGHCFTQDLDNI